MSESRVHLYADAHLWGPVEITTSALKGGRYTICVGPVQLYMTLEQLQAFAEQVAEVAAVHTADADDEAAA